VSGRVRKEGERYRRRRDGWRTSFPNRRALIIAIFTCVVAPTTLAAVHIHENPVLSPADEAAHFDYVTRLAHGGFPRIGQLLQPSTLRIIECRRTGLRGLVIPPCNTVPKPDRFPGGGEQYEAQQPPAYYALTVPLRWLAVFVFGFSDLTGTRATGIVWLVLGLLLLWVACRVLEIDPMRIGVIILLIVVAPVTIYSASNVTNDAASIATGGLVLLVGALAWKHPGRWTLPVMAAAGAFVVQCKLSDALPVVVVAGLFAIAAVQHRHKRGLISRGGGDALRYWGSTGGALLCGAVLSAGVWVATSNSLAIVDPRNLAVFDVLRTHPVSLTLILRESLTMIGPLTESFNAFRSGPGAGPQGSAMSIDLAGISAKLFTYLLVAGGLSGLFVRPRKWFHDMGLLTLPALYLGGVILGLSLHWTYNIDPSLSGRYGLALGPFLAIALVASAEGQWVRRSLCCFGLIMLAADFSFMLAG
jgi:hypothetical protein